MRILFLFAIVAVFPIFVFSQSNFKPAFIVKNNGDTVRGFIEQGNEDKLFQVVPFRQSLADASQKLTPADISDFGFDGGNTFKRFRYNGLDTGSAVTFAKYLLGGYNNLYVFSKDEHPLFLVQTNKDSIYVLYDDIFSAFGTTMDKGNFRNILYYLSRDCGALKDQAERISLNEHDMIKFVSDLNQCLNPSGTSKVAYVKPKTQLRVYAYAGGIVLGSGKSEVTGRVMARFIIPSVDKKTSLNVGLNYMSHQATDSPTVYFVKRQQKVTTTTISLPLSVQYDILSGIVRPYVEGGVCIIYERQSGVLDGLARPQTTTKFTPFFSIAAGVECPVSPFLMIKGEWRYNLISHYPTIGIAYFFK